MSTKTKIIALAFLVCLALIARLDTLESVMCDGDFCKRNGCLVDENNNYIEDCEYHGN